MTNKKSYDLKVRKTTIIKCIFIIAIITQAFTATYESVGLISQLKYIVCMVGILTCLIFINKKRKRNIFKYEFKQIVWVILSFLLISAIRSIFVQAFTIRTILEIVFLLLPLLYAYCLLNTLDFKIIDKCMFITLIVLMVGYFFNLDLGISELIRSFKMINFSESYSPFESSSYSGVAIILAMYFLYFRKNKLGLILSIMFVFFTFKRLAVLFVIFLLLLPRKFREKDKINIRLLNTIKVILFILSIGYFIVMIPKNVTLINEIFNINLYKLTMSRTYRFSLIYNNPEFINSGFGSTFSYMVSSYGVALEMDMIKLIIEVTPIGAFILINNFINISKKNIYVFSLMLFQIFNLITSHSLVSVFSWLLFYLILGCIIYEKELKGEG